MKQTLKEWSGARARIEVEVQRKQEHQNSATKFAESRAFKRSNLKSKGYNHEANPLLDVTSSSEDDEAAEEIMKVTGGKKHSVGYDDGPLVIMDRAASMLSPD